MKKLLSLLICLAMALVLTGAVFAGGDQEEMESSGGSSTLEASLALDSAAMALKAADGQPLLILAKETRAVPKDRQTRMPCPKMILFTGMIWSFPDGPQIRQTSPSLLKMALLVNELL